MTDVDHAKPEDACGVFDLLKICYAEDGGDPVDDVKLIEAINAGINRTWAAIGVIRSATVPVAASIGLFLEPQHWYSSERRVISRWEFVHPAHRRSDYLKRLISFAKQSAAQLQRPLSIPVPESPQTARKKEMMARHMESGGQIFTFSAADCAVTRAEVG